MNDDIVFDNFLVTDDRSVAEAWGVQTFEIKSNAEKAAEYAKGVRKYNQELLVFTSL